MYTLEVHIDFAHILLYKSSIDNCYSTHHLPLFGNYESNTKVRVFWLLHFILLILLLPIMNMLGLNTQQSYLLFLLLVALELFSYSVRSMRFDLSYDKAARCFSEDVKKDSVIVGNYSIVNTNEDHPLPPHHTINVQVFMG